ncbi:MAG: TolC family protein [Bacteriovoracia bacterium]
MKSKLKYCSALLLFLSVQALAQETESDGHPHSTDNPLNHIHGSHPECPQAKSAQDIVLCAKDWHPDARKAKAAANQAQSLPSVARQLPNPEFETQTIAGQSLGDQIIQSQISVVQPLEIGGKRGGRIKQAEARVDQANGELLEVQAEVILKTVTHLHRLRQLEKEKALLEEAIQAFSKIISQYKSRPRLPAEQEVSLAVFEMAVSDFKIKRSVVLQEERSIAHFFHVATGNSLDEIRSVLPKAPASWPDMKDKTEELASPTIRKLLAEHELSLGEQESARGASWPNLSVGPMVQYQAQGPIQYQMYGFQLNMTLPVLSLNGGGREYAAKGVARSETNLHIQREYERHERSELLFSYETALSALKEALSDEVLDKKHHKIEQLSVRGLISSSLVIESHRQLGELQKTKNDRELKAIETLWQIYKLDGRIFKESL